MTDDETGGIGPEFEVWNHLWSGIDMATNELRALDAVSRARVEKLGKAIVDARSGLVQQPDTMVAKVLLVEDFLLADPWIRHAAEIEIAATGVARAENALARLVKVRPAITRRPLPSRATRYVSEVINTFMFGFDAACIALCRATLEQVLRDELVRHGSLSQAQLRRERPTAGSLLQMAFRAELIHLSRQSAEKLVAKGDTVMHKFIYEERISEQQALDSVEQLVEVLGEILGQEPHVSSTDT